MLRPADVLCAVATLAGRLRSGSHICIQYTDVHRRRRTTRISRRPGFSFPFLIDALPVDASMLIRKVAHDFGPRSWRSVRAVRLAAVTSLRRAR